MKLLSILLFLLPTVASVDTIQALINLPTTDSAACYVEYNKMVGCIRPHQAFVELFFSTFASESGTIYNLGFMNKAIQVGHNISECMGHDYECEIPRMVVYALDYGDYITGKLYGDAFHCFINSNAADAISCPQPEQSEIDKMYNDVNVYNNLAAGVFDCLANKMYTTPSCTIERIVDLYQAGRAFADAYYQILRWDKKYPVEWKFDGEKYCDN